MKRARLTLELDPELGSWLNAKASEWGFGGGRAAVARFLLGAAHSFDSQTGKLLKAVSHVFARDCQEAIRVEAQAAAAQAAAAAVTLANVVPFSPSVKDRP